MRENPRQRSYGRSGRAASQEACEPPRARARPASPVSRTSSGRPSFAAAALGRGLERRRRLLRQPHHPPVVAEVRVAQVGIPVEPEAPPHEVVERLHQEVGEEERARLLVADRGDRRGAGEQVVAGLAGQPLGAQPRAQLVDRAAAAAVGVADRRSGRSGRAARAASASRAGAIRSGRLCSSGGSGWTSSSRPFRAAMAFTWRASAPQASTATRLIPGTPACR